MAQPAMVSAILELVVLDCIRKQTEKAIVSVLVQGNKQEQRQWAIITGKNLLLKTASFSHKA